MPYRGKIWLGGKDKRDDVLHLRKVLAKCLCSSKALWWFDMWGGWYDSVLDEMEEYKRILDLRGGTYLSKKCKAAVFVDETAPRGADCALFARLGIPYGIFLKNDFAFAKDYGLFVSVTDKDENMRIYAENNNIPYISAVGKSKEEISNVIDKTDFVRINRDNTVYLGNGFIAVHGSKNGKTCLHFDRKVRLIDAENEKNAFSGKEIYLLTKECETLIFKIDEV